MVHKKKSQEQKYADIFKRGFEFARGHALFADLTPTSYTPILSNESFAFNEGVKAGKEVNDRMVMRSILQDVRDRARFVKSMRRSALKRRF